MDKINRHHQLKRADVEIDCSSSRLVQVGFFCLTQLKTLVTKCSISPFLAGKIVSGQGRKLVHYQNDPSVREVLGILQFDTYLVTPTVFQHTGYWAGCQYEACASHEETFSIAGFLAVVLRMLVSFLNAHTNGHDLLPDIHFELWQSLHV